MADENKPSQEFLLDELNVKFKDKPKKEDKKKKDDKLHKEIICILMIVTGLIILISLNNPDSGLIVSGLNGFMKGLFGRATNTLPIIIIALGFYLFSTKDKFQTKNLLYGFLIFLLVATIFHILTPGVEVPILSIEKELKTEDIPEGNASPEETPAENLENPQEQEEITPQGYEESPPQDINQNITPRVLNTNIENQELENPQTEITETPEKPNPKTSDPQTETQEPPPETNDKSFVSVVAKGGNGGYIGAFIGSILIIAFGRFGAFVLSVTFIIVIIILITGKSFLSTVTMAWLWIYNKIKDAISELYNETTEEASDVDYEKPQKVGIISKISDILSRSFEYDYEDEYDEEYDEEDEYENEDVEQIFKEELDSIEEDIVAPIEDIEDDIALPKPEKAVEVVEVIEDVQEPEEFVEEEPVIEIPEPLIFKTDNTPENTDFVATETMPIIKTKKYIPPSLDLLITQSGETASGQSKDKIRKTAERLVNTLKSFGVVVSVTGIKPGPTVTRYELKPGEGVKVSKISSLSDDIALSLAAQGIRIEAPIPGKSAVGVEVPNEEAQIVYLRDVIDSREFRRHPSDLAFAIGKDIEGKVVISDISKMPHLLIAGATGSGKSVCINTLVTSIIYKSSPKDVKLLMIDPKVVELSVYNDIPHLIQPVITDPKKAAGALSWAVNKMIERYSLFSHAGVRDIYGYNEYAKEYGEDPLPKIVIIIDELSDLMMSSPHEVEDYICRLAQMARAAGMHLIIATQRPSVDVITGIIKANIPSRLAFAVSSGTDSRTILDMVGAEKLLGKGDMLFSPVGINKPKRIQGAYISDKEVENIVKFLKPQRNEEYDTEIAKAIDSAQPKIKSAQNDDDLITQAIEFVVRKGKASGSLLQRQFGIGYNKGARIIEELEVRGIVGPADGSKQREVLMTLSEWEDYKKQTES